MSVSTEEVGDLRLADFASCHGQSEVDETVLVGLDLHIVHGQENDGRRRAGPLVPVHERVVLHDVVEVATAISQRSL